MVGALLVVDAYKQFFGVQDWDGSGSLSEPDSCARRHIIDRVVKHCICWQLHAEVGLQRLITRWVDCWLLMCTSICLWFSFGLSFVVFEHRGVGVGRKHLGGL
jgi:hypothetical protein